MAQYDRYVSDQSLQSRLDEISSEIRRLTEEVDETALRAKLERALLRITTLMSELLPALGVENSTDPASLSISELTLKIKIHGTYILFHGLDLQPTGIDAGGQVRPLSRDIRNTQFPPANPALQFRCFRVWDVTGNDR